MPAPQMHPSMKINLANWEERVPAHAASARYGVAQFVDDPAHISRVVAFDRPRLGDLHGLRGVHLQCHIGTDTVSLARLGASMVGLDFSPAALAQARELAARIGADASFVESELYDAPQALGGEQFDFVYTGIGALCWLPDIRRWARVVADVLKPDGRLLMRDGHPMLYTIADPDETKGAAQPLIVDAPYFETAEPIVIDEAGTYVDTDVVFETTLTHEWNHGLGETVTALHDAGLRVTTLLEHDSAPWDPLPGMTIMGDDEEWRLIERRERLPLTFTLHAVKTA